MPFPSRPTSRCLGLVVAATLVACTAQRPASNPHAAPTPAPVLCAPVTSNARAALQKKAGYQQVALSVKDESGREVQNLGKDDFIVKRGDDALPVQFAEYVGNGPASVMIVADTSGSSHAKLDQTREAITQVVDSLDYRDDVSLVAFSGKPFLLQAFTLDHSLVIQREAILHAFGSTSLYDSVLQATLMVQKGCYARRVLVVISDGMDNTSGKTLDDVSPEVRSSGVSLYAIAIGSSEATGDSAKGLHFGALLVSQNAEADSVDEKSLGQLTNPSGGSTFRVGVIGDRDLLAAAAKSIMESSQGQYVIGFVDAAKTDTALTASIKNHDQYVVTMQKPPPPTTAAATQPSQPTPSPAP